MNPDALKLSEVIALCEKLASKKTMYQRCEADADWEGFFDAESVYGGNIDDAYQGGVSDGEIELAQRIMEVLSK